MDLHRHHPTALVANSLPLLAAGVFIGRLLWQIWTPNVSAIAKNITVRIDGANTGSGVIVKRKGDRYTVLSNWHVISSHDRNLPAVTYKIRTKDGQQHLVATTQIRKVGGLDLAVLEFRSRSRYPVAAIGNSDKSIEGDSVYIAGWADPTAEIFNRSYQFLAGNLSGRIDRPRDGYALAYSVNALPGMSGGPILDRRGNLIGINGRATIDLRTGTVNSVLGIDINRYLRASGNLSPSQPLLTH